MPRGAVLVGTSEAIFAAIGRGIRESGQSSAVGIPVHRFGSKELRLIHRVIIAASDRLLVDDAIELRSERSARFDSDLRIAPKMNNLSF